jgi:hypothetical protein
MSLTQQFGTKSLVASAAFALLSLVSSEASAEYICSVLYRPGSGTFGSEGYTHFTTYSQPGCQGAYQHGGYICSTGASISACPSNAGFRYERQGMMAMLGAMQRAAAAHQRMLVYPVACNSGTSECYGGIIFENDP